MKIGGFVKQSLIDYPGKIAAVVFTQGCNFRCGYCHNPQLVLPELFSPNDLTPEIILEYLEKRKTWLTGVVITGGEPTIHSDLPAFLKKIKEYGYAIKLDTNGSNPLMLHEIIKDKLADYIAMDIKAEPETSEYSKITGIEDINMESILLSINLLRKSRLEIEFRTTLLPGIHSSKVIENIRKYLGAGVSYTTNNFRNSKTVECCIMEV